MAEPLSIIANLIAVLGAVEDVGKTLAKIPSRHTVSDELLALINEISDFKIVLSDIQSFVVLNTKRLQDFPDELQNMLILTDRAKKILAQLDELIQYRLVKPDSTLNQLRVSRRQWLKANNTVKRFRRELRDVRLNFVTQMIIINSCVSPENNTCLEILLIL